MMTNKLLTFPVVAYKENEQGLYVFLKKETLIKTSVRLYNEKVYDGVFFIDSEGCVFKVLSVVRTGWGNLFMGYSLVYKARLIKIEFSLEKVGGQDINEFKEFILSRARHHLPNFSEIEEAVRAANTYERVIQLIQ